jgi:hypothetical protein
MARGKKKVGVDPAAPTATAEPQVAVAESTAPAPETVPDADGATAADVVSVETVVEAPVSAPVVDDAPSVPALEDEGEPTQEDGGKTDEAAGSEPGPSEYPKRVRVTNCTRMPIQIAVVPLAVGPAPASSVITVPGEREYAAMLADLNALRELNGFDDDAFKVETIPDEDDKA